jgi:hypothetical protein
MCVCTNGGSGPCCDQPTSNTPVGQPNPNSVLYTGLVLYSIGMYSFAHFTDQTTSVDSPIATCISLGTMMRTFDGRSYKFGMKCHYILAMTASDTYEDTLADWKVSVETENCDKIDTCKKVHITRTPLK